MNNFGTMGLQLPDDMKKPVELSAKEFKFILDLCSCKNPDIVCSERNVKQFECKYGQIDAMQKLVVGVLTFKEDALRLLKENKEYYEQTKKEYEQLQLENQQLKNRISLLENSGYKETKQTTEVSVPTPSKVVKMQEENELVNKIIKLKGSGFSERVISERLGISKGKIYNIKKKYGIK